MRRATFALCVLTLGAVLSVQVLSGADSRGQGLTARDFFSRYQETDLISDVPGLAIHLDENLVNAWGIVHGPTSPWWINANGTGLSLVKNGSGDPFPTATPLIVTIPGSPTGAPSGIVFNGTTGFDLASGEPARFMFAAEDGTISGWNPNVNATNAIVKVTTSGAVYKGLALASVSGNNYLYAANLMGSIEVFDTNFASVNFGSDAWTDDQLPSGYHPFNVQNINGTLYVTFALTQQGSIDEVHGAGLGYVDAFSPAGELLMRFQHGPWLNAPWGLALAPSNFGKFSSHLLVGQFGSGRIAAYDPDSGEFKGLLKGEHGTLMIDGLWGIGFGNDGNAGPSNTLFFAAGIEDEAHGLFGTITPIQKDKEHEQSAEHGR